MNNIKMYICESCNYTTSRSYDYNRHMNSYKHLNSLVQNNNKIESIEDEFYSCICKKKYKYKKGLTRHKNSCKMYLKLMNREEMNREEMNREEINNDDEIGKMFDCLIQMQRGQLEIQMRQTTQTQHMIERMDKQDELIQRTLERQIINNIGVQNVQNNHFCLNIFLNETCKNAIDLDDFVDSIEVGIEDIERMERLDYASGISKLIVDKLNQATVTGRPLHCTDSKRETIYIKIKTNWQKADDNLKIRFVNAIKRIAQKNMKAINLWIQQNPEWNDPSSKANDKYLKIVSNSMSGSTEEEQKCNMDKIVKNIIREVKIDKNSNT